MTRCTICSSPTPGDDDANEAFCGWCLAHAICPPQDLEARRQAAEVERRLAVSRLAVSRLAVTRLAQTIGRP